MGEKPLSSIAGPLYFFVFVLNILNCESRYSTPATTTHPDCNLILSISNLFLQLTSKGNSSSDVKVQAKSKSGHIKHLPYDILLDIFSRVPVESVLDCKQVCKNWLSLLTRKRTYFTDMHVQRQLNQLHDGDAANVDSGLLCARTVDGNYEEVALFYGENTMIRLILKRNTPTRQHLKRLDILECALICQGNTWLAHAMA
ncbi:uncharacterized protein LOC113324655 [Papaver somniferum]|uniref:uncharacterized protein LOC113324655 n=1 Tax=Papaver somniferum TaxID=3469 RepID=UPI000E6F94C2|nr:uncharacterized protein LOC113324655 [Papaver somniferum]